MDYSQFDRRPLIVAIAGPNGAGKSTFYYSHLSNLGFEFVNAEVIAADMRVDPWLLSNGHLDRPY